MIKYNDWFIVENSKEVIAYQTDAETFIKFKLNDYVNKRDDCYKILDKQLKSISLKQEIFLDITVVMTHKCNLTCIYCFESKQMLNSTSRNIKFDVDRLLKYLYNLLDKNAYTKVIIRFFGGEPLIEKDSIILIMNSLLRQYTNIKIVGVVFTNAYSLNEDTCVRLRNSGIKIIHTTLDGYDKSHNLHKTKLNGEGTFGIIFNNISTSLKYFQVTVRVNISKLNIDDIGLLFKQLALNERKGELKLDIRKLNYNGIKNNDIYLSDAEFMILYIDYLKIALSLNLDCIVLPQKQNHYCVANNKDAFIIEPYGGILRCTEEIGDPTRIYTDIENSFFDEEEHSKWMQSDYHNKCKDCLVFELCRGKCPRERVRTGNLSCTYNIQYFESLLNLKFKFNKMKGVS
ncbi:MAG: radical SAM protein [Anaerocolumna sp.]